MFKRLSNLIKGFLSRILRFFESSNPEALIEAEKENIRNQVARFNESLSNHAAFAERLTRQVRSLSAKERELTAKINANIKAGNRKVAGQLALQLQTIKQQLQENQSQLEIAEQTFKNLEKQRDVSIQDAQEKIQKLQNMLSETQMFEAQAELQEMAKAMRSGINLTNDSAARVTELLEERRDKAAGKARVALSSTSEYDSTISIREEEYDALGEAALEEFLSDGEPQTLAQNITEAETIEVVEPLQQRNMGPTEHN